MSKKVLITEDLHPFLVRGLENLGYECDERFGILQQEVTPIIHLYHGIVVATRIIVGREIIERASSLKFIARAGSGMENIDVVYAEAKNISCISSPEGNANSVGEHAAALLLAIFHNITQSFLQTRNEQWLVEENRVHELDGRTIAIIGYGNTGKAFAKKLPPFNMKVLAYDKYLRNYGDAFAEEAEMKRIFDEAEIISFHVPLTEETKWMIDTQYLQRFKEQIHLINTSRGKIIRHKDLLECIHNGKVLDAALDVYENENLTSHTQEERNLFRELINTGRVIFTPHVAGKSFESKKKIAEVLLKKISSLS
ncbi:MAG TPA: NAD(P)-dependent oxidoreductase [Chitinophagales bacterium]|nr:NAD(P)-dependent oxidoreductase [Chitinophagales bacterium]